jgi:hypothetical protein
VNDGLIGARAQQGEAWPRVSSLPLAMSARSGVSSWFSRRFKKHFLSSSPGNSTGTQDAPSTHRLPSSLPPPSQQHPLLRSSSTDVLDVPRYHAHGEPSHPPSPHPPSISSASAAHAATSAGVGSIPSPQHSTRHLEDSACGNITPTNPGPTAPLQLPKTQASTLQGPSVSAAINSKNSLTMFALACVWWSAQLCRE